MSGYMNLSRSQIGLEDFGRENLIFLITEDEDVNYQYLKALFRKTGVHIVRARNGLEAVDIVQSGKYRIDLILMDIKMPVMDGIEATKKIKSSHPEIPVIAQTAYAMSDDREKCLNAGFNEYLSKPIRRQSLFPLINNILNNTYQSN